MLQKHTYIRIMEMYYDTDMSVSFKVQQSMSKSYEETSQQTINL